MIHHLRYRLARRLVGRFVVLPEPKGEHPLVILVFPGKAGYEMQWMFQPTSFRLKSRVIPPSFADAEVLTIYTPRRRRTTFVGIVEA